MKKVILSWAFVLIATTASNLYAINYPSYSHPSSSDRQVMGNVQDFQPTFYGGYSTIATGGTTTTGEGALTTAPSGPRRTNYNGGSEPQNPDVFDTWTVNGTTYYWNGSQWVDGFGNPLDPGVLGNDSPLGSPVLPMLLMALLAAGAVYLRRRKALLA